MLFSQTKLDQAFSEVMGTPSEDHALPDTANAMLQLPRPPSPSTDRGIVPVTESPIADSGTFPSADDIDIFTLKSVEALRMLCSTVETLVETAGDIPPMPPISQPNTPNLGLVDAGKENVARHSEEYRRRQSLGVEDTGDVDGVPAKAKTPIGSPEAGPSEPLNAIGSNSKPPDVQLDAITRKFYSKKPPPISLEEYLMRLHRYCPMSTAVYLATSLYIFRLAVVEKIIPVTSRNVHRLVLGGLRVAMKALEDFSYPHRRFAKVGGVSETELGRLEVNFCFITNFELRIDREGLLEHAKSISSRQILCGLQVDFRPQLPPLEEKRNLVVGPSKPPTAMGPATAL